MNNAKTIVAQYLRANGYSLLLISSVIDMTRTECLKQAAEIIDGDPHVALSLVEDMVYIPDVEECDGDEPGDNSFILG